MTADIRPPPKRQKQVKSKNCTTKTPAVPVIMRKPDFNFLGQKRTKISGLKETFFGWEASRVEGHSKGPLSS